MALFPSMDQMGAWGGHSRTLTDGPTIVIGRKGSFGEVHFSPDSCWPIDTTYYVDSTSTKVDLHWLFHVLSSLRLTELNRAAAIPGLNREDAYRQMLLLPPLHEQRHIVAILDQVENLTSMARQAVESCAATTESFFHDAFAELPAATTVESITAGHKGAVRTGPFGSQLLHSEFTPDGVAVLGIDNEVFSTDVRVSRFLGSEGAGERREGRVAA